MQQGQYFQITRIKKPNTHFSSFPLLQNRLRKKKKQIKVIRFAYESFSLEQWTTAIIHTTIPYALIIIYIPPVLITPTYNYNKTIHTLSLIMLHENPSKFCRRVVLLLSHTHSLSLSIIF